MSLEIAVLLFDMLHEYLHQAVVGQYVPQLLSPLHSSAKGQQVLKMLSYGPQAAKAVCTHCKFGEVQIRGLGLQHCWHQISPHTAVGHHF